MEREISMERQISIRYGQEELTATIHYPVVRDIKEGITSSVCLWRSFVMVLSAAGLAWTACS